MPAPPVDERKLLSFLYRIGAFWNPITPNGFNVDFSNVGKLRPTHRLAREAVASWQSRDANFSEFTRMIHGRPVEADGEIGPATVAMLEVRRCGMPDYAPPPTASFSYEDPGVQAAVESYQRFAEAGYVGGLGSWPRCDPMNPDVHSVVVAIDTSAASSAQKAIVDQVLRYVAETEAEIGQSVRFVRDGSYANPQHNVRYESIAGSVIGYAYFPDPNNCRQIVQARIDNTWNAPLPVMAELHTHEYKGHSDGAEHTNGGIMNPSIGNPTRRASWIGDISYPVKRRWFGGVAIPTGEPPATSTTTTTSTTTSTTEPTATTQPTSTTAPRPDIPPPTLSGKIRIPIIGGIPTGNLIVSCNGVNVPYVLVPSEVRREFKPVRKTSGE